MFRYICPSKCDKELKIEEYINHRWECEKVTEEERLQ
jgi:hypothetical protein